LASSQGEHALAQRYIQRAVAILEEAEDTLYLARAHLLYAESLVDNEDWDEASARLDSAHALLGKRGQPRLRAWLALLRAQVAIAHGEVARAEQLARQALELAGEREPELLGRSETLLGEALWRQSDRAGAHSAFSRADELLAGAEPRFVRRLLSRWADLLESEGELQPALALLRRSAELGEARPREVMQSSGRRATGRVSKKRGV
jgi:predicted negative regulator of RcsB-dependent stress response